MHQHFLTKFRLVKKKPSASLRNFRRIGSALPTRAETNHKISKKETVFGSAGANLPRMEISSSSPHGKVPLKLCLESGRTVLRRVDVNRELEVSKDRLKPEILGVKGRVQCLFWTSKWLSKRRIEGGNYEVERLVDHSKDAEGNWRFLVKYKELAESEDTCETPSSFVHGYTTGFRNYLRAHREILVFFY